MTMMYSHMVVVIGSNIQFQEDIHRILTSDIGMVAHHFQYLLPEYSQFLSWIHQLATASTSSQSVLVTRGIHKSQEYNPNIPSSWFWLNIRLVDNRQSVGEEYHVHVQYIDGETGNTISIDPDPYGYPIIPRSIKGYWQFTTILDS